MLCTGGFQTATRHRAGDRSTALCDAVTIARPLIANNDLVKMFAAGSAEAGRSPARTATSAWSTPSRTRSAATNWSRVRLARRDGAADHDGVRAAAVPLGDQEATLAMRRPRIADVSSSSRSSRSLVHDRGQGADWRARLRLVSRRRRSLQVRLDRHRGARRPSVLDLAGAADRLRGQAAEAAGHRLRAHRLPVGRDAARAADRHVVHVGPCRARRPQLRDLSRRHVSRDARRARRQRRARHARQPDGPAGLRALPDRRAPRIRASTPAR